MLRKFGILILYHWFHILFLNYVMSNLFNTKSGFHNENLKLQTKTELRKKFGIQISNHGYTSKYPYPLNQKIHPFLPSDIFEKQGTLYFPYIAIFF